MGKNIRKLAEQVQPFVCQCRHILHQWPEVSFEEHKTTDFICKKLDELGIPYRRTEPTGCIAEITGAKRGKTVALRADIDGLNIHEDNDLPFCSKRPGFMHGCGHDTHAAMLLGAAKILQEMRDDLSGTVRLLFQPAEETGEGAKALVEQGALDGVDACFGQHIFSCAPVGEIKASPGPIMPAADRFVVKIHGLTSHGAAPHAGIDALVCGASIVMNLQTIVSREIDPQVPIVVTIGAFHSGSRYNVCPGEAELEGTVRIFDEKIHQQIPEIMKRILDHTAAAYRCTAELHYIFGSHALVTDGKITETIIGAAKKITSDRSLIGEWEKSMGSEDFSEYSAHVPSGFAALGCGGSGGMHNEHLIIDEDAFITGVALHVQFVLDYFDTFDK